MITLDKLKGFGANTEEGLARCMNNEEFYLKMVNMGLADERFEALGPALESGDKDTAFELAHALKGVLGNLSLTPIYDPFSEMTELLRAKQDADYKTMYEKAMGKRKELLDM